MLNIQCYSTMCDSNWVQLVRGMQSYFDCMILETCRGCLIMLIQRKQRLGMFTTKNCPAALYMPRRYNTKSSWNRNLRNKNAYYGRILLVRLNKDPVIYVGVSRVHMSRQNSAAYASRWGYMLTNLFALTSTHNASCCRWLALWDHQFNQFNMWTLATSIAAYVAPVSIKIRKLALQCMYSEPCLLWFHILIMSWFPNQVRHAIVYIVSIMCAATSWL